MLDMSQIAASFPEHLRPFKRNLLREYLQYKVLEIICDSAFGGKLAFMGGTAIHIVHAGPRFSEDLDFDNRGLGLPEFEEMSNLIRSKMGLQGFDLETKVTAGGAFRMSLRFPGMFLRMGLSTDPREKLDLRIDAAPQHFEYEAASFMIDKFDVFGRILVAPADLLLAQKIFCLFSRPRAMGRDLFDIVFLWGKTEPRPDYLKEKMHIKSGADLKERLTRRCAELDLDSLAEDVAPFVYRPEEVKRVRMFRDFIAGREFKF